MLGGRSWLQGLLCALGAMLLAMPGMAQSDEFDLQGHRGARGLMPENSHAGFIHAMELGVTTLELDLVLTKDRVLVVNHDRFLDPDRVRDPEGNWISGKLAETPISELSARQLEGLQIGRVREKSRIANRFPDQAQLDDVPFLHLEHLLYMAELRSNRTIRYNIELKRSPLDPEGSAEAADMAQALAKAIQQSDLQGRAMVQSFDWSVLDHMAEFAPDIGRVYLTAEQEWLDNLGREKDGNSPWLGLEPIDWQVTSIPQAISQRGGKVWSPYFRDLTDEALQEAQSLGLKVVVWTVNKPEDMSHLIDRGVDGIITDYPDRLRAVMAEKGMKLPRPIPKP